MPRRSKLKPTLSAALTAALKAPPPSWERLAAVGFAGADLDFRLTVHTSEDVDLSPLEQAVASRYRGLDGAYESPGRRVRFDGPEVSLYVSGSLSCLPGDDGGTQSALLLALFTAAADSIEWVETERWTNTPFEEPPAKRRVGRAAREYLEALVFRTLEVRVVELQYFSGNANPRLDILLDGAMRLETSVRARWLPSSVFVLPGVYEVTAAAKPYSFPDYRPALSAYSRFTLWTAPPLRIEGAPGEVVSLRVGVDEAKRGLTAEERAFFGQPERDAMSPPPEPRENLFLERWSRARDSRAPRACATGSRRKSVCRRRRRCSGSPWSDVWRRLGTRTPYRSA